MLVFAGLSKLYSLEVLDLQSNDIAFVLEIHHISSLPCLEHLILTGNPITVVVDYRTKVFELFTERAAEVSDLRQQGFSAYDLNFSFLERRRLLLRRISDFGIILRRGPTVS